jgi:hypothetical protein
MLPLPASRSDLTPQVAWERHCCSKKFNHRPLGRALLQKASHSLPRAGDMAGGGYDLCRVGPAPAPYLIRTQSTCLPTALGMELSRVGTGHASQAGGVAYAADINYPASIGWH